MQGMASYGCSSPVQTRNLTTRDLSSVAKGRQGVRI